jgi:hypothetical protein
MLKHLNSFCTFHTNDLLKCKHNIEVLCCYSILVFSTFILCVVLRVCCHFVALDVSSSMFGHDIDCTLVQFSFLQCCFLCVVGCRIISMKSCISSDTRISPSSTVKSSRCFEGISFMLVSCLAYSSTLNMEAICSSENSVNFQRTTWHYISEDRTLHSCHCGNFKCNFDLYVSKTTVTVEAVHDYFIPNIFGLHAAVKYAYYLVKLFCILHDFVSAS